MKTGYAEHFDSEDVAARYDTVVYAKDATGSVLSRRQRAWLRHFVAANFDEPPTLHDFACGTGRVLAMLGGVVAGAHGYDTSDAMLARARDRHLAGTWHLVERHGAAPYPQVSEEPRLVTMFRLFLNSSPEVRERALMFAARALPTPASGRLVIENHGNSRSLRRLLRWRNRKSEWFNELSHAEVQGLLHRHGFQLEAMRGFSLFPRGVRRMPVVGRLAELVDEIGCKAPALAPFAVDLVYVARPCEPESR